LSLFNLNQNKKILIKTLIFTISCLLFVFFSSAQTAGSDKAIYGNLAEKLIATDGKLTIGGYARIDYNQSFSADRRYNVILDIHRLVAFRV
jgi:hypothetical protein